MVASKDSTHENNITTDLDKGLKVLKTAAIYGANASGKTNDLKAIRFLRTFLETSHEMQQGKKTGVESFKLDKEFINKPMFPYRSNSIKITLIEYKKPIS